MIIKYSEKYQLFVRSIEIMNIDNTSLYYINIALSCLCSLGRAI